jgi:molybdopterin converting factor small subunit
VPVLHVPAPLRSLCEGCDRVEVEGATLRAVFDAVAEQHPELVARIVEDGALRPDIAVAIDGSILDQGGLVEAVAPDAEIYLVPPIGGGAPPRVPPIGGGSDEAAVLA